MFGPNIFVDQNYCGPKVFSTQFCLHIKFLWTQNFADPILLSKTFFLPKIVLILQFLWTKNHENQKKFYEKILGLKNLGTKIFFEPTVCSTKTISGPKLFLDQIFVGPNT